MLPIKLNFNMKKFVFIISVLFFFFYCEKEINLDIEITKQKLVVNSIFNRDSLWRLDLSTSQDIFKRGGEIRGISDANVVIKDSKNDTIPLIASAALSTSGNAVYISTMRSKPKIGETYSLEIDYNGFDRIIAQNTVPNPVVIRKFERSDSTSIEMINNIGLSIEFEDNIASEDYYHIEMMARIQYNDTVDPFSIDLEMNSTNPIIENDNPFYFIFNDRSFNGETYTIALNARARVGGEEFDEMLEMPSEVPSSLAIILFFTKLSRDLYRYNISYGNYVETEGTPFALQPPQVLSNIENGFGIFGAYTTTIDSIQISFNNRMGK